MHFLSLSNFQNFLLQSKLVESAQLNECMVRLQSKGQSIDGLIKELESLNLLTSYQLTKLRKRDVEGLLLGEYKLLYRNGSGSFARVFRACSTVNGRMVGIKMLRSRWAEDPKKVTLFKREGELGKRLKHKNIVPIFDVRSEGNIHYLTMEFVEGGNFRELLKSRGGFSPYDATRYAIDIAEGLEYALTFGVTHRDLKMTNVLLSAQGVAKLVDFGLAGMDASMRQIDDEVERAVEYATLERGSGAPENDPRSDLYFLGAMYYELLTGKPPYPSTKNREERRQFSRYRDIRPIRQVDPSLPEPIVKIVTDLMRIHPYIHYQDPTQLLKDLRTALRGLDSPNGQSIAAGDSDKPDVETEKAAAQTILCVEDRVRQQDSLRNYFSKHGYRVLLLGDFQRALGRLQTDRPKGLILMSDALGHHTESYYQKAVAAARPLGTAVMLILSEQHRKLAPNIEETEFSRVLSHQPVTLRTIRTAMEDVWSKTS